MTLDQCYAHYQGTSVDVDGVQADTGQCVQWVDVVLMEVYGQHIHYGNAIDWWTDPGDLLTDGFVKVTDGSIKKGDFVIFNQKVGSVYGHIDVAMQDGNYNYFLGSDTNWAGNKTVHLVNHYGAQYIQGVLRYKQGATMATDSLSRAEVISTYCGFFRVPDSQANQDVVKAFTGKRNQDLLNYLHQDATYQKLFAQGNHTTAQPITKADVEAYINQHLS